MIISHKYKFIFLKSMKTAGTSIEIALSKLCGDEDIITSITTNDELARIEYSGRTIQNVKIPISRYNKFDFFRSITSLQRLNYYNHITAREVKRYITAPIWKDYYKFTIERNPYDKLVSYYYWKGGDKKYNGIYDFLVKGGLRNFKSFNLYTIDGVIAVDKIYKYEDLDFMCSDLTKKLKLSKEFKMPTYKAKSNLRKVKNYKDIIDKKSLELLNVIFAREIKLFEYKY